MKLNLNVCSQNQFNFNDGTCFTIDFRWDGVGDCVGTEDEETCNIIQFTDSYFNNIPPYMYYGGGIVLSMTVLNVTDVQELSGIVKAHLKVNLEWKDVRFMVESFYFIFADQGTFHIFYNLLQCDTPAFSFWCKYFISFPLPSCYYDIMVGI